MVVAGSRVFEGGEAHAGGEGGETKLVILGCPHSAVLCLWDVSEGNPFTSFAKTTSF